MQISKVSSGATTTDDDLGGRTSLTPLVELIPGVQQPIYTDDDLIRRSRFSSNLDLGQDQVYLKVVISQPTDSDLGEYRCSMTYLDSRHELGRVSDTNTLVAL